MNKIKRIVTKRYKFRSKHVPKEFEGIRIVFLTDIHHGKFFSAEKLRGLVEMTNNLTLI